MMETPVDYQNISYKIEDSIAYIGFGHNCDKSMTVLGEQTLKELNSAIDDLYKRTSELKAAIFFTHKDRCFLAGADINLINAMKTESDAAHGAELGQTLFNRIEDLKIMTIACVHGVCLGGGTEFILSCDRIFASDDKSTGMGLPEVKLGLIPGFGGTYRMPKKVGLVAALDLILTGKTLKAKKAKKLGLVEEVYPKENLIKMAVAAVAKKPKRKDSFKDSLENLASDNFISKKIIFQKARENVLKKTKGFYQAPLKILDVMEAGMMKGRTSYLSSEAQAFGELCISEQSQNLQHLFFLVESGKKYPGESTENPKMLKRGAVLGAGTMGGGIAWLMADAGMAPLMKDLNKDALELGLNQSSSNFGGALKRRKISKADFERKQRSIQPQLDYSGFNKTDLVIEAVVENMDIKKKVFAELETKVNKECILTSNTSSLSVNEMASALEDSSRFAGLHFFNPVHRMPLVEIIKHDNVSNETLESLYKWVLKTKKTPVIVGDGPGFLVNRILMPFLNEAGYLMEEGVRPKDIDEACLNFGMPMGPCRLFDEIGIDVAVKVAKILEDGLGARSKSSSIGNKLVDQGLLGKKSDKGFYLYDEKGKEAGLNSDAERLLPSTAKSMSETEIQMRVVLPMINEAASCLQDGIVDKAGDVDLSLIFGIGFPPFRGGLLRYADSEGLDRIVGEIKRLASEVNPDRYVVCDYLQNLVDQKKKFYEA
jgi:3-hydroxyacyl-CoA dehydrogenase/enoyl-CoA hydratase/3-hydroxybutyryl-CoA epimerase